MHIKPLLFAQHCFGGSNEDSHVPVICVGHRKLNVIINHPHVLLHFTSVPLITWFPPESQSTGPYFLFSFLEQMEVFGVLFGLYTSVSYSFVRDLRSQFRFQRVIWTNRTALPLTLHPFWGPAALFLALPLPHTIRNFRTGSHWLTYCEGYLESGA